MKKNTKFMKIMGFFYFMEKSSVGFVLCQRRVKIKCCSWEYGAAHPVSEAKKNFLCVTAPGRKTIFQGKYDKIQVIFFIRKHLKEKC